MEHWEDTGIVLSVRGHGDHNGIVSLLTHDHGRTSGYVHGAKSSKMRGCLELGSVVNVTWSSKNDTGLGSYKLELMQSQAAHVLDDQAKLTALQSACALADKTLGEREPHKALYDGMLALLNSFQTDIWQATYIYWEMGLLRELGFGLDLTECAATGDTDDLIYVSPKSGRAVSRAAGLIYKDKMLSLPGFLIGQGGLDESDIIAGLDLMGYFLLNRVFATSNQNLPEARLRLAEIYQ